MAQILVPASDVATGGWTATPLWSKVDDDSVANPTGDGVEITSDDNTSPDNADFALTAGTDPSVSTGHILRARWYRNQAGGHNVQGVLELWQGVPGTGTLIATLSSAAPIETAEVEDTYTLSAGEADAITDYTTLHLRLQRSGGTGGNPGQRESLIADLIELEVPDAGTQHNRTPQDDVGITDTEERVLDSARTVDDAAGITDTASRTADAARTVDDAAGLADTANQALEASRSSSDAVGITDDVTYEKSITKEITDPIGVTDDTTDTTDTERTVTDPIGVADTLNYAEDEAQSLAENQGITDTANQALEANRTEDEAVGITDSLTTVLGQARTVTDAIGVTDTEDRVADASRTQDDAVGLADALNYAEDEAQSLAENVGITDTASRTADASRTPPAEAVGITDSLVVDLTPGGDPFNQLITDAIGIADALNYAEDEAQSLANNVGITDSLVVDLTVGAGDYFTPTPIGYTPAPVSYNPKT